MSTSKLPKAGRPDLIYLWTLAAILVGGFTLFFSASLGLHGREGYDVSRIVSHQLLGVVLGLALFSIAYSIPYEWWKRASLYLFLLGIVLVLILFIPGVGVEQKGAVSWIYIGPLSFQPAEYLKIASIIYFAAIMTIFRSKLDSVWYGLLPIFVVLVLAGVPLLLQPDTGTFFIIAVGLVGIYVAGGARWSHIALVLATLAICAYAYSLAHPHVAARFATFLDSGADIQGNGYQVNQALIAIGSGGITGRGFGESVQKFHRLPEPIGDSIFAVAGEEFGLVGAGTTILIIAFLIFRMFTIARRAPTRFGGLLVSGIAILIAAQTYMNIGSMLAVAPLTGLPLMFVSKGGTAMMFALFAAGIVANVSKYATQRHTLSTDRKHRYTP